VDCAETAELIMSQFGILIRMGTRNVVFDADAHWRHLANTADSNDNNNSNHDNVYGAIIVTKVIARVHPVHLMNVVD